MNKAATLLMFFGLSLPFSGRTQSPQLSGNPRKKCYFSTGIDGYILSTALVERGGSSRLTTPRFTAGVNIGLHLNYDLSKRFGLFTGLGIKNIGFIEKFDQIDSTVKRRVYTLGVPLGIKWGDVTYGSYLIAGVGADLPFNYREKGFIKRNDKKKFNEWFSDRTPLLMPYAFIGVHLRPAFAFKLQYYPQNFLNTGFTETVDGVTQRPYEGVNAQLFLLTAGFDIPYRPKQ